MIGKYKGQELAPLLKDREAILRPSVERDHVLAQFSCMLVQGTIRRPGEGVDSQIPYCFGWHEFHLFDFDIEKTLGHGVDCRCLVCLPEPHSLDNLRGR